MKLAIIFLQCTLAGLPVILSCDHHTSSDPDASDDHHAAAAMPRLDNGKRWLADAPTRRGFARLRADLPAVSSKSGAESIADYNARANKVAADINAVFAACKMSGPAHAELHKYIALLLRDVEPMRGKDLQAAQKAQEKLIQDVDSFTTYFE